MLYFVIGMVVDVNVLVFEWVCEELVDGDGTLCMVLSCGFGKVWSVIFDVNVMILFAVGLLFFLVFGLVCGFGVIFIIGVLVLLVLVLLVIWLVG